MSIIDSTNPVTIVVDAMGGYHAPDEAVAAVAHLSKQRDAGFFTLVGDETRITDLLVQTSHNPERINVVHAPTSVSMAEPPRAGLQGKPDASICVACRLVADGHADAIVTAGNPGAAILSAFKHFDMIEDIRRGALASVFPTTRARGESRDRLSLLLDVGATMRATAEDLVNFAVMGSAYARIVSGVERPRVVLLSNSRESNVGPPEVVEAYRMLREHPAINFYGNVEGHEIPSGDYDVVVCEGFVGDITIKVLEGTAEAAVELAKTAYERKFAWRMGLRLLSGPINRIRRVIDFEEYGGAPLLGTDRVVILAHPHSRHKAIANAIKLAAKNARARLPAAIVESMR